MLACRLYLIHIRGGSRGTHAALKLEKIWFFGIKLWFFTRNTPTIFAPSSGIGKKMILWREIVIFHTKYPKYFRPSLRSVQFFLNAPTLTWNPGSAPAYYILCYITVFIYPQIIPKCFFPRVFFAYNTLKLWVRVMVFNVTLKQYVNYMVAISFIGNNPTNYVVKKITSKNQMLKGFQNKCN